jgi:hypothetical protein
MLRPIRLLTCTANVYIGRSLSYRRFIRFSISRNSVGCGDLARIESSKSPSSALDTSTTKNSGHIVSPVRNAFDGAVNSMAVLSSDKVRKLIEALPLREKTLVLLAAGTDLQMSELVVLKWGDVHF